MTMTSHPFRLALAAVLSLALTAAAALMPARAADAPAAGADRTAQIEEIVRSYLMRHPEVIVEALEEYRRQAERRAAAKAREAVARHRDRIFEDPSSPVGGNPEGDVALVEFFDYRCGVCKRAHPVVARLMESDPGIKRIYKEWPILGPESTYAARAALAAREQGKYLVFHDALMEAEGGLNRAKVMAVAREAGLDTDRLRADMKSPEIEKVLRRNFELAEALGVNGTPTFVIGETLVRGTRDLETFRRLVEEARKEG